MYIVHRDLDSIICSEMFVLYTQDTVLRYKDIGKEKTIQYNANNSVSSSSNNNNGTELKFNHSKPFSNVHLFIAV